MIYTKYHVPVYNRALLGKYQEYAYFINILKMCLNE